MVLQASHWNNIMEHISMACVLNAMLLWLTDSLLEIKKNNTLYQNYIYYKQRISGDMNTVCYDVSADSAVFYVKTQLVC